MVRLTQRNAFSARLSACVTTAIVVGIALITQTRLVCAAEALSIADFVGHFRGEAQVQAGDRFFVQQLRDAEVDLRTEADGFRLNWSTVIHYDEADNTKVRRRNAEMRFVAGQSKTNSAVSTRSSRSPRNPPRGPISTATP